MQNSKSLERFLEIIPGALTWATLLAPFFLSYFWPSFIAILILVFDLYWFFRSLMLSTNTIRAYKIMSKVKKNDWHAKIKELCLENESVKEDWDKLKLATILVHYKESYDTLALSIESYANSDFPKEKMILILASEDRNREEAVAIFEKLKKKFGHKFSLFVQTLHPDGLPGEMRCKSANATWGGRWLKKYCDKNGLKYNQVLINNFDADTQVYYNYFNYLTYSYLTTPKNQPTSYQPIHVYANNIWETHAIMRVVAMSSTLIFMHNTLRPFRFQSFSSRSDNFQTVVDIDFWTVNSIPEDSRQYFDAYFKYHGNLKIMPMYIPLKMDAVYAGGFWPTLKNQYRQLRRWAWGVSDFPYVFFKAKKDKKIPWSIKWARVLALVESHWSWAIAAVYISLMGWLPQLINPAFNKTVLGNNFPIFSRLILSFAGSGFFVVIILSLALLPPRPAHHKKRKYLAFIFQWILSPVVSIFFSSLAAIDAQTRLMIGKRLDYQVTEKKAVK